MWIHKAEAGTFWIRFVPRGRGEFVLGIDGRELGTYFSPEAAADAVYLQDTGFAAWDSAGETARPAGLDEWVRLDCAAWDSQVEAEYK